MSTKIKILILSIVATAFITLLMVGSYSSYYDSEADLRTNIEKKQEVCKAYYTKMVQIFKDKAAVKNAYKEDATQFGKDLIEGRYDNDNGKLMMWIQEQNPQFSADMYKDLMNTIQSEREGFFVQQEQLLDLKRQHDNLFEKFWSGMFMDWMGAKKIEVVILQNPETKQAYSTGIEVETSQMFESK